MFRRLSAAWSSGRVSAIAVVAAWSCMLAPLSVRSGEPVAEPDGYKSSDYRSPVPPTLAGAKVIDTAEARILWESKGAVFVDVYPRPPKPANLPPGTVWRDPRHASIEGAHWLPNVGYGVLAPAADDYFRSRLAELTARDFARPVVFFCLRDCWMSWNAAKRALGYGYRAAIWFPDGTDGWTENGWPLIDTEAVP